ncbi:hypothetical protein GCM10022223_09290 [Kineosporia mesophila]|uniref:Uncharacterized protein n=1 Tax=Kineosporia mesophila TaxID=566012 RepID=A0ABP6Z2S9_9ACTN
MHDHEGVVGYQRTRDRDLASEGLASEGLASEGLGVAVRWGVAGG